MARAHGARSRPATAIQGPFGAAKVLGINPRTLRARMRKLGLEWQKCRGADGQPAQE